MDSLKDYSQTRLDQKVFREKKSDALCAFKHEDSKQKPRKKQLDEMSRNIAFKKIASLYRSRYAKLLVSGKLQHPTEIGYWAPSNPEQLFDLFKKLHLEKYSSFADLGSGDGVVIALSSLFTDSVGFEADGVLVKKSEKIKKNLQEKIKNKNINYGAIHADFLMQDLSVFDILFINPDTYFHKLEKKLVEEFKGTLIVSDNIFRPLLITPKEQINIRGSGFSVYYFGD